jgi:hypothetical protein
MWKSLEEIIQRKLSFYILIEILLGISKLSEIMRLIINVQLEMNYLEKQCVSELHQSRLNNTYWNKISYFGSNFKN